MRLFLGAPVLCAETLDQQRLGVCGGGSGRPWEPRHAQGGTPRQGRPDKSGPGVLDLGLPGGKARSRACGTSILKKLPTTSSSFISSNMVVINATIYSKALLFTIHFGLVTFFHLSKKKTLGAQTGGRRNQALISQAMAVLSPLTRFVWFLVCSKGNEQFNKQ